MSRCRSSYTESQYRSSILKRRDRENPVELPKCILVPMALRLSVSAPTANWPASRRTGGSVQSKQTEDDWAKSFADQAEVQVLLTCKMERATHSYRKGRVDLRVNIPPWCENQLRRWSFEISPFRVARASRLNIQDSRFSIFAFRRLTVFR